MKKIVLLMSFLIIFLEHQVPCKAGNAIIVAETLEQVLEEQKVEKECLTKHKGVFYNESGYKETYYNLNMSHIVKRMRRMGFYEEDYPFYIREDGCKMLGDFIMVAADLSIHKRGSIVMTSLGQGLVCDTGCAIKGQKLDIATSW